MRADIKKLTSEVSELTEAMNSNQNNIYRSAQKLDAIREQMNWNQQELSEWLEKARAVEEDAQALEKYSRADEAKIKEISLQTDRLVVEAAKAKKLLDQELTETHVNQIALEKVGHFAISNCSPTDVHQMWK